MGNAVEAICGPATRRGELARKALEEGRRCLEAAGIDYASTEETGARWGLPAQLGLARPGSSSWQSLERGTGRIETDYLNGEIVLLGRLAGCPTPVNWLLQHTANQMAARHEPPGSRAEEELRARLETQSPD